MVQHISPSDLPRLPFPESRPRMVTDTAGWWVEDPALHLRLAPMPTKDDAESVFLACRAKMIELKGLNS